jgi:hypothetical protein
MYLVKCSLCGDYYASTDNEPGVCIPCLFAACDRGPDAEGAEERGREQGKAMESKGAEQWNRLILRILGRANGSGTPGGHRP